MDADSSSAEGGVAPTSPRAGRRRRWLRVVIAFAALMSIVVAGSAWVMSSFLVKPGHHRVRQDTGVVAVHDKTVVLQRTDASTRPGVYGLVGPRGHAVIGPVVAETASTVTRELRAREGRLDTADKVGVDLKVWESDPKTALGVPFQNVDVPGPLGSMPAWYVPSTGRTWAIIVHGINGDRDVGLRIVPTVREAGYPSLLIRLRNDRGAPRSPDGQIHLGMTEWEDLDAAAAYALSHGARHLVLVGYSMGAAIASRFMRMSRHASAVRGLVFDSALLDWRGAISHVASRYHIGFMARPVQWAVSARIDIDWDALDTLKHVGELRVPILAFHGLEDSQVPPSQTARLAKTLPRQVTHVPVEGADHLESWNVNPSAYERRLARFLRAFSQPPQSGLPAQRLRWSASS